MNYKQSVLNNNSNIRKHNLNQSHYLAYKAVSKHYKAINFSLVGNGVKSTVQNEKDVLYIRPLRIIILQFHTLEKSKDSYSIDVSCFFNKPLKSVILKHSKKIKISKQFAHWLKPYNLLKQQFMQGGFNYINNIVGSDISMHEYELYIDLKLKNIPLAKSHISYIVAQTLCKAQRINKSYQASYSEHIGVVGAFILKNGGFKNNVNSKMIGYFISDHELKQCALANFRKRQTIEVTQWPRFIKLPNETIGKLNNLLGGTLAGSEQVRSSASAGSNGLLVSNLQSIVYIGTLSSLKSPLRKLVNLLTLAFARAKAKIRF
nr:hypothetical protein [Ulva meridionalis]